jgi:3-methyladenine DNA glycosylase AlkD
MKYSLLTPEIEAQRTEIRRKIRLSMNGIVSDQMIRNGIIYKNNYGVSIPRIKEIARNYQQNHDLAQSLWNLQIRETMILATMLEPVDKFTRTNANEYVSYFNQIEIVEQTCMNLFCKLSYANTLCKEWIQSENQWIQITGFILAARIVENLNSDEINRIINIALKASETTEFHLYKAVALCLSRFCRKDIKTATYIQNEINVFTNTTISGQKYIYEVVKQELLFLNIL